MDTSCPECENICFFFDDARGDVVCPMCGYVALEKEPDFEHQTKSYMMDAVTGKREPYSQDVSLVAPITGYTIYRIHETKNVSPSSETLERLARAQKFNTLEWKDARLLQISQRISQIVEILNLPSVFQQDFLLLFQKIEKMDYFRGRKIKYIIPALILEILPGFQTGLTQKDVLNAFDVDSDHTFNRHEFNTAQNNLHCLLIQKGWNVPLKLKELEKVLVHVRRYAPQLGITFIPQERLLKLIIRHFQRFSGQKAKGIAAGALYLLCRYFHISKSQWEIAELLGINEITLRTSYKKCIRIIRIDNNSRYEYTQSFLYSETKGKCVNYKKSHK